MALVAAAFYPSFALAFEGPLGDAYDIITKKVSIRKNPRTP